MLKRGRGLCFAAALLAVLGCAQPSTAVVQVAIPTSGPARICPLAQLLPFILKGDSAKRPAVWGIDSSGKSFAIVWPAGFVARFAPALSIVDGDARVVAHGGERITDASGASVGSTFYVCSIGGHSYAGG